MNSPINTLKKSYHTDKSIFNERQQHKGETVKVKRAVIDRQNGPMSRKSNMHICSFSSLCHLLLRSEVFNFRLDNPEQQDHVKRKVNRSLNIGSNIGLDIHNMVTITKGRTSSKGCFCAAVCGHTTLPSFRQ